MEEKIKEPSKEPSEEPLPMETEEEEPKEEPLKELMKEVKPLPARPAGAAVAALPSRALWGCAGAPWRPCFT